MTSSTSGALPVYRRGQGSNPEISTAIYSSLVHPSASSTSSGYCCCRLSFGVYHVPLKCLKNFPIFGCGLNGWLASSLKLTEIK